MRDPSCVLRPVWYVSQVLLFGSLLAAGPNASAASLLTKQVSLGKVLPTAFNETLVLSPDQKHVAYVALRTGKWVAVIDGVQAKPYDRIVGLRFSPDSKHTAYAARRGDNFLPVLDGREGKEYDDLGEGSLTFSPDNKRFAYQARKGEKWIVVVDGVEGVPYEAIGKGSLLFNTN